MKVTSDYENYKNLIKLQNSMKVTTYYERYKTMKVSKSVQQNSLSNSKFPNVYSTHFIIKSKKGGRGLPMI